MGTEEKILLLFELLSLKKKNLPFNFLVYEPLNSLFCLMIVTMERWLTNIQGIGTNTQDLAIVQLTLWQTLN